MKILSIRFENLNSLAGEWSVDFSHPDYAASGIFAITGPTGSGKSTLLDAISLALYGRTPRLERVTESGNEIMSRHTGACFSEVLFETKRGRFRCHWSQRRARNQSAGRLQSPRHEIADGTSGKVLESKLKDVARKVEEVTGMDFDQFTRSVLLAQGGFAAFLQASPDERAPILEQITGTEIYSRLSQKVHERKAEEQQRLALLEAETNAVTLLSDDQEALISADLADKQKAVDRARELLEQAHAGFEWLGRLETLAGEIAALETEAAELATERLRAEPDRLALERARKVQILDGSHRQLCRLRGLQEQERTEREVVVRDREKIVQLHKRVVVLCEEARARFQQADTAYREELVLAREVRELDAGLKQAAAQAETVLQERKNTERELQDRRDLLQRIGAGIDVEKENLGRMAEYLRLHERDAGLVEDLAGLQELVKGIVIRAEKMRVLERDASTSRQAMLEAEEALRQAEALHANDSQVLAEAERRCEALLKEAAALSAGRDPAVLRDGLEKLTERKFALERIQRIVRQAAELETERAAADRNAREAVARLEEIGKRRRELSENILLRQRMVEQQEKIVRLADRVRSFEDERERLIDGEPCPLCGAVDHPYAAGAGVEPDEAEEELRREREALSRLQKDDAELQAAAAAESQRLDQSRGSLQNLGSQLSQLRDEQGSAMEGLTVPPEEIEPELAGVEERRSNLRGLLEKMDAKTRLVDAARDEALKAGERCGRSLERKRQAAQAVTLAGEQCESFARRMAAEAEGLRQDLAAAALRMARYGVEDLSEKTCGPIVDELAKRQRRWREEKELERLAEARLQKLQSDREREQAVLSKQEGEIERIAGRLRLQQDELTALRERRFGRYGEKDPDREERQAEQKRSLAENGLAAAVEELHRLEKEQAVLADRLETLDRSLAARASELAREERDFTEALAAGGFADEADFNSARLSDERIREIANTLETLARREAETRTLLQSRIETRRIETEKRPTESSADELTRRIEEQSTAMQALQQQIGMLRGRLADNAERRQRQESRHLALDGQRRECARWQRLHELIGSADGKKFRNFAQGITFEIMVGQANRGLRLMTDRYILTRDDLQPLELNVIDNYQAGEVRSTKNLSGGESFIVSLALALGLAAMAGKNVRVDSLFLDEGFGTLDEEALETALETLAGLQQDGKIIGIISHVPALQERIATRIQVIPGTGGRSRLQGPGISHN